MPHARSFFESLESRRLLDGHLPYTAYFPEGFAGENVNEYVPMTNPNAERVEFELHARYEWGERDQIIASGSIRAGARDGVTITEFNRPDDSRVRRGVPYALVLKSSLPLAATMSHYDFGTAVGESFTTTASTSWSFGDGVKDTVSSRDFFLVFNPNNEPADVTLTLYGESGELVSRTITIRAERRGGWSVDDIAGLPDGVFAAKITSTLPVVAAQSHYELPTQRGYGLVGTPGAGAVAGALPSIEFDDSFYDSNGDDSGHRSRHAANAYISILNANDQPASVTLNFLLDVSGSGDPPPVTRTVTVGANSRGTFSVRDLGLAPGSEFGVVYRADRPVTVTGSVYQGQDGTGINAMTKAATVWDFGEGFMSRTRAGREVQEDIYFFNPGATEFDVTVTFFFIDGTTLSTTKSVDALELEDVKVHRLTELVGRAEDQWYGVRVSAPAPIVASMEHWDGSIGGGFGTFGTPSGVLVDLSSVLVL